MTPSLKGSDSVLVYSPKKIGEAKISKQIRSNRKRHTRLSATQESMFHKGLERAGVAPYVLGESWHKEVDAAQTNVVAPRIFQS